MFERFSRDARVVVVLAQEEARELRAKQIRPEHLLLGVLQSAGPRLSTVFEHYGLSAAVIRQRLRTDQSFNDDAAALSAIGIDLEAVRDSVSRAFGDNAFDEASGVENRRRRRRGHIPFARASKKVLELSLRKALVHSDRTIEPEHLLLGIVCGGGEQIELLVNRHVDTSLLCAEVGRLLDQAA